VDPAKEKEVKGGSRGGNERDIEEVPSSLTPKRGISCPSCTSRNDYIIRVSRRQGERRIRKENYNTSSGGGGYVERFPCQIRIHLDRQICGVECVTVVKLEGRRGWPSPRIRTKPRLEKKKTQTSSFGVYTVSAWRAREFLRKECGTLRLLFKSTKRIKTTLAALGKVLRRHGVRPGIA